MQEQYGIILLERDEILVCIFVWTAPGTISLFDTIRYDLSFTPLIESIEATEFIETIAAAISHAYSLHIAEWLICTRGVASIIAQQVRAATGLPVEVLSYTREQELICKGKLLEMHT